MGREQSCRHHYASGRSRDAPRTPPPAIPALPAARHRAGQHPPRTAFMQSFITPGVRGQIRLLPWGGLGLEAGSWVQSGATSNVRAATTTTTGLKWPARGDTRGHGGRGGRGERQGTRWGDSKALVSGYIRETGMLGGRRVKWREDAEVWKVDRRTRRRHTASHEEDTVKCDAETRQLLGDKRRRPVTKTRRRRRGRSDLKDLLDSSGPGV